MADQKTRQLFAVQRMTRTNLGFQKLEHIVHTSVHAIIPSVAPFHAYGLTFREAA